MLWFLLLLLLLAGRLCTPHQAHPLHGGWVLTNSLCSVGRAEPSYALKEDGNVVQAQRAVEDDTNVRYVHLALTGSPTEMNVGWYTQSTASLFSSLLSSPLLCSPLLSSALLSSLLPLSLPSILYSLAV